MIRLVVVLALLASTAAFADEDPPEKAQARLLLSQGNALFEKGDLRGALVAFRAAYALYPSAKLLVNCAAAARELGDLSSAANDLRKFLDESSEDDPSLVERAKSELRQLEKRTGKIALTGWPRNTTVEVGGKPARDPFYVRSGVHSVRARAPAGNQLEKDVVVSVGETVEVPMPALVVTRPPPGTTAEVKPKSRWWIGVVVGGVAAVALGVGLGVGLGVSRNSGPLKGDLGTVNFSDFR